MLTVAYTIDLQLREILQTIDRERTKILSFPLSPKSEYKLQWEAMAIRIWATLSLSGFDVPKQYVSAVLSHPGKPTRSVVLIQSLRRAYDYIHDTWRASAKPVSLPAIETIATALSPSLTFSSHEGTFKELLTYLDSAQEHPLIQAAIAHRHILSMPGLQDSGLIARATHYLFLSKYGYDVRGYVAPERIWQSDPAYERTGRSSGQASLNMWLGYMGQTMQRTLETLSRDVEQTRFNVEYPPSFWLMSDRQKEILSLLELPQEQMTNRNVQKRFRVSQVTASRDLAKLTSLGLLYAHGKGRSVYYTKI